MLLPNVHSTYLLKVDKLGKQQLSARQKSKIRVPIFAACTLNATGQYRVTLSLR